MNKTQFNFPLIFVTTFFAIIYSLISLVNHYNFRTSALDLGAYTNALYDYIHFQLNDSSVFKETNENLLADHFDLYLILFSPFSLLFGTYTLLIVQIISVLAGGIGIYKYFSLIESQKQFALLAAVYFYLFFGVYSALSYDYHSNVVAAMIIPWFFFYFRQKKYFISSLLLLFMIVAKENISLWLVFICIGLLFEYRKEKAAIRYLIVFLSFSSIYFIVITGIVMPSLVKSIGDSHFKYAVLGNNFSQAFLFLITHPLQSVRILFINHLNNADGNFVKAELHILLCISGLFMLFFKPQYLIILVPVYFQKLFHDDYSIWSVGGQYSVEFAPILAIGIFSVISNYKKRIAYILSAIVLTGALVSTIRIMDRTIIYTNKSCIRIYQSNHYQRNYNVKLVHKKLNEIPIDAIVSAETQFVPHLALRDKIYQFPIIKDAEYIIYSPMENAYPLNKEEFKKAEDEIMHLPQWKIFFKNEYLVILRKQ